MKSHALQMTRLALAAGIAVVCLSNAAAQPGGGTSTTSVTYYATYKLDGGSATQSGQSYAAANADTSGVWVTDSGSLTLTNSTIKTSGNTSSQDNSSFYGLNAGLLSTAGGVIHMTGGSITTTGTGANGAFSTGTGSSVTLSGVTISGSADGAHAVMATQTGSMTVTNCTLTTSGGSSSAIATDRGGGTINVTGGSVTVSGGNSAGIYSTGTITASGTTFKSTGAEMAVIEGANSIALTDVSMTTTMQKWGVMIYQSMSGDASGTRGVFTMTGGSLTYTPSSGPLFYVTNSTGVITLKGVSLTANSGILLNAAAGSWGTSGSNGGTANLTADGQTMTGNFVVDNLSALSLTMTNGSSLTGAINAAKTAKTADAALDSASNWTLTADSYVSAFSDASAISGGAVANVTGNGHDVYYDASLSANSYLGGKTYSLVNGGYLLPTGSTVTASPSIDSGGIINGASLLAGMAPDAWVAIKGANLATTTAIVTTSDLVNGYLPTTFGGATVTINNKPASIDYVSPAQINVQAPDDSTVGSVTVTVKTAAGTASASADMESLMPGLFTNSNYVLAVRWADSVVINGTGAARSDYATAAAARAGDNLEIYGTGFGSTTTATPAGLVFSGAYPTAITPTVTIGGVNAAVLYCGLAGTGLYQINLTVPGSLSPGTYPVVVSFNGVQSPSSAVLKIAAN